MSTPPEAEPKISLVNIVKDYRGIRALDGVSLDIGAGITGLLGPNGAGKSTLIKVLLGLVRVNEGTGTVLGHNLQEEGREIRAKVGYVPEDDCYIGGMSGVEVVRFSACLSGLPATEALRRSHEILDFCGMDQERYREIDGFSTGMRQKIKFAQAIVHDPPLLILDEPTSGLDPEERVATLSRIRILSEKFGKTVIISTHILPDVQSICDDVVVIAKGKIKLSESLEVLNRPSSPGVNVRVVGSAEALNNALQRSGYEVQQPDHETLIVHGRENHQLSSEVWRLAQSANIVVSALTPMRNSLEEVFMNAVRESTGADS